MTHREAKATARDIFHGRGTPRTAGDIVEEIERALLGAYEAGRKAESAEALKRARQEARSEIDGAIKALEHYRRMVEAETRET